MFCSFFYHKTCDIDVLSNIHNLFLFREDLLLLSSLYVMSESLPPHGLQCSRLPCPLLSSCSLLRFMSIESAMPFNRLFLCCPLLLLPSTFPSIRVFFNKLALCIRWLKYWNSLMIICYLFLCPQGPAHYKVHKRCLRYMR